ncbi:ATP-binding protein [Streptomyces sp. NPDC005533]|uniref:ATP-binding protein n=1 Tax=Streptomyces sp. NPDC005533 TaxID=3364723 RepID=UPI0036A08A81
MSGLRAARHAPSRHAVTGPGRQIRPQLVRAAVLPTLAAALSGAAAVIFTLQLGGGAGDRDARLWPVLTGCALLVVGALAAALLGAQRGAKAVRDRCEALRRSSVRGRQELRTAADLLERGETPPRPVRGGPTGPLVGGDPAGVDEFWLLSQELRGAREQAHATLVRLAGPATPSDSERKVEVFVNLARRLQSLVHREIALLDELEDTVEDPDLLKELFHVDHLATRIRRHAENLAVLGGSASRRQWTRPIDLSEVLRSSVAEVEQYTRVKVVPPAGGSVRGHAVADVVHLLAELVENATVFSPPDTDVVLRAERVTAGIAVEVEDRGLGMPVEEQHRMNALLGDPDQISVRHLLADGRIGLFVVSALARRHGIAVELKSNIYGGVLAVLVLPQELLGAEAPSAADVAGGSRPTWWGTAEPPPAPRLEPVPAPQAWSPTPPRAPAVPAPRSGPAAPTAPAVPSNAEPDAAAGPPPGPSTGPTHAAAAWPVPLPAAAEDDPAAAVPRAEPRSEETFVPVPAAEAGYRPRPVPEGGHSAWSEAAALPPPAVDDHAAASTGPESDPRREAGDRPVPRDEPAAWPVAGAPATAVPAAGAEAPATASAPLTDVTGSVAAPWTRIPGGLRPEPVLRGGAGPGDVDPAPAEPWAGDAYGPEAAAAPAAPPGAEPWTAAPDGPVPGDGVPPGDTDPASAEPWARDAYGPDGGDERMVASAPLPAPAAADPAPAGGETWAGGAAWARSGPSVGEAAGLLPLQRGGEPEPEGGEERPSLPRRRAQQHLAPQLREAPVPRPAADAEQPLHDPGLMAAFQRGFGLAQSENER